MKRYDLISPRERKDKTFWVRVGAAFERDKGGFTLAFDALPLPDKEGRVNVLMVEPSNEKSSGHAGGSGKMDDEIPF